MSALRPLVFFDEAKFHVDSGGILHFCLSAKSPASNLISRYHELLKDSMCDFWRPVRGIGAWTQVNLKLCASLLVRVVVSVWYRLIRPFQAWPWLLAKVVCPEVPSAEADAAIDAFMHSGRDCCFGPGLARHVRACVRSADDLKQDPGVRGLVYHTLRATPSNNIPNEDRFARQAAAQSMTHGKSVSLATACTRHVLTETQAWHHIAAECSPAAKPVAQPRVARAPRCPWDAFVRMCEAPLDLQGKAQTWRSMSEEERRPYREAFSVAQAEVHNGGAPLAPAPAPIIQPFASPYDMGSRAYPVRERLVETWTANVG